MSTELEQLRAYKAYIERNIERMQQDRWIPICFQDFLKSDELEITPPKSPRRRGWHADGTFVR